MELHSLSNVGQLDAVIYAGVLTPCRVADDRGRHSEKPGLRHPVTDQGPVAATGIRFVMRSTQSIGEVLPGGAKQNIRCAMGLSKTPALVRFGAGLAAVW